MVEVDPERFEVMMSEALDGMPGQERANEACPTGAVGRHDPPEVQRNDDHQPRIEGYETVASMQQAPSP